MSPTQHSAMPHGPERTPRPVCPRCRRPLRVCYCNALTTIETRSRIVILQHPREHGMPIGTAHMASLCLPRSSLHVGVEWDESDVLREACADPERPPVLLYPGGGAKDVLADPPPAPVTLIVVDGTWSQAHGIVRDNPRLAALPRYAFHAPEPSRYRIRPEPSAAYVSTLEALMHVLGAIEGQPARFRALLAPLRAMVDAQLEAERVSAAPPRTLTRRNRRTPYERLPRALRERYEDLVLVYGDANAWPWDTPQRALGDELVYWTALRPGTGETFEFVVAPRHPLAPDIPRHTEVPAKTLRAGGSVEELLSAFAAFSAPKDVLASWGHHALRMLQDCGWQRTGPYVDLRHAARLLTNERPGALEAFAARAGVEPEDGLPPYRAGRRLGLLAALVERWRALEGAAP